MAQAIGLLSELVEMMGGRPRPEDSRSRKSQLAAGAALGSLAFAALWGLSAGAGQLGLALQNLYKVPMVVLLSGVVAAPAGLLALKLWAPGYSGREMLLAFSLATFAGTLVLAVVSPLIALYYHTSSFAGPLLGTGSVCLALGVGITVFVRHAVSQVPEGVSTTGTLLATAIFAGMLVAVMVQLIALASPILTDSALFTGGIDQITAD